MNISIGVIYQKYRSDRYCGTRLYWQTIGANDGLEIFSRS